VCSLTGVKPSDAYLPLYLLERRVARGFAPRRCDCCLGDEPYVHTNREAWKLARAFALWSGNDPRQKPKALPKPAQDAKIRAHVSNDRLRRLLPGVLALPPAIAAAASERQDDLRVYAQSPGGAPTTRAKIHCSSFEAVRSTWSFLLMYWREVIARVIAWVIVQFLQSVGQPVDPMSLAYKRTLGALASTSSTSKDGLVSWQVCVLKWGV
jgi:hypothetical protein